VNNFFETSFGRKIQFYPGYKERYPVLTEKEVLSVYQNTDESVPFYAFMKDSFEYGMMIDFLTHHGVQGPWESALDLGGAEGTISRHLKSEGIVKRAECLDIKDFSKTLPDGLYDQYRRKFRLYSLVNRLGIKKPNLIVNFPAHFCYHPAFSDKYYNLEARQSGRIDNYYTHSIYDHQIKYDFISALLCFPYFDLRKLFPQISSLLNQGGIFYFITDYWWSQINSSQIIGNFPYACQRLTKEDLITYFKQFHPDETPYVQKKYDYYHCTMPAPVVSTYVKLARDSGLDLIAIKRQITQEADGERILYAPQDLNRDPRTKLDDVLTDIHQFRQDVKIEDLMTAFVIGAFVKR